MFRLALLPHCRRIQGHYYYIRSSISFIDRCHVLQASFAVSNVEANIKNTGMSAVRSVLGLFSYDQVSHNNLVLVLLIKIIL